MRACVGAGTPDPWTGVCVMGSIQRVGVHNAADFEPARPGSVPLGPAESFWTPPGKGTGPRRASVGVGSLTMV